MSKEPMKGTRFTGKKSLLAAVLILTGVSVFMWFAYPAPPLTSQAEAFAHQDASRYIANEVCDEYRRWPVVYDFDAPVYSQTKHTLAMMEALTDAGFVTRTVVPNRGAGPVQYYPHEKRIYEISSKATPYVRERRLSGSGAQGGERMIAMCFGRYEYDHFVSIEAWPFSGDDSQIQQNVFKDSDGTFRTSVRYSIRASLSFHDWANSVNLQLHGHKVDDDMETYRYRRLADMLFFSDYSQVNSLDEYVKLKHKWRGWQIVENQN
jgi:hypothetical protein